VVVRALRSAGYDVVAVAETSPRMGDDTVLRLALDKDRILLTEDKDFGELIYARAQRSCGVILLRFPAEARSSIADSVLDAVTRFGDRLPSSFVVIS